MTHSTEPCGCKSSDNAWLSLCPAHEAEWRERHERAQAEKDMAELVGRYSTNNEDLPA